MTDLHARATQTQSHSYESSFAHIIYPLCRPESGAMAPIPLTTLLARGLGDVTGAMDGINEANDQAKELKQKYDDVSGLTSSAAVHWSTRLTLIVCTARQLAIES